MVLAAAELEQEIERLETMQDESLADQLRLWDWGQWARHEGKSLGYPPCLLQFTAKGSRAVEKDLRRIAARIDDDEALRIDAAVARLPFSHRKVIIAIYKAGIPKRDLPNVLAWPERRIAEYRHQAVGMLWIILTEENKGA
jgi:hypothetical protein